MVDGEVRGLYLMFSDNSTDPLTATTKISVVLGELNIDDPEIKDMKKTTKKVIETQKSIINEPLLEFELEKKLG